MTRPRILVINPNSNVNVTKGLEEALKPLMDAIGSADIRKICLREPSLEDVFIELTGRKVRE